MRTAGSTAADGPARLRVSYAAHRSLPGATEEAGATGVALDAYDLIEQMRMAGCDDVERRAVVLWLRHRAVRRVAVEMGLPRAQVVKLLRGVAATIAAWRERGRREPTRADILGVYASEISRHGQVGERHCLPGEEECMKTGLCNRRWYLFREPTV